MLSVLEIKNIALIEYAKIIFDKGLNVLSGETGSGKSVIIESLNFVLGAKADKTLIKSGETECFVKAEFTDLDQELLLPIFNEIDIEPDNTVIITRKMSIDGKGAVKINGETVTVSMLKKLTALLVDVHGQSEHFYLLKQANQLELLDKLSKDDVAPVKELVKKYYDEYKTILSEIKELGGTEKDREIRLDVIDYQINEIESVDLKEGEEEELAVLKQRLINLEKIQNALSIVKSALSDDGGVSDILYNAQKALTPISSIDDRYEKIYSKLNDVSIDLDDVSSAVSDYLYETTESDFDVDYVEERLDKIKLLKRKYGDNYMEINAFLTNLYSEKDKLINFNSLYQSLINNLDAVKLKLYNEYKTLSDIRRKCSLELSGNVINELKELGITKGQFFVNFNDYPSYEDCSFSSANGVDDIDFMFSANLGQPVKPLSNVISGGEMSRFMLAVKSQTAKHNDISTFIFDEIDAGISGNIAKVVGEKFAKISKDVQVIAITHLPQISVMADNNILISKTETADSTFTTVKNLSSDEKVAEIIRLVGGETNSSSASLHAKEMILEAEKFKKSI